MTVYEAYLSIDKITDENELDLHSWRIFNKWRARGFPHFELDECQKLKEFSNLQKLNLNALLENKKIKQAQHGLGLAWTYFKHHWSVKCNNNLSVMDVWDDDRRLIQAIRKALKAGRYEIEDYRPWLGISKMRQAISYASGVQRVSNFRPSAAALIYEMFGGETVWDMSAGYGGRLLGAIASTKVKKYIGTEPEEKTMIGLHNMKMDLAHLTRTEVELLPMGSEDFLPEPESLDLAFTSPPYFDTEKYSNDSSQSYVKFPSISEWNKGFLERTIQNAHYGLKQGGHLIMNVANTQSHLKLEEKTKEIAQRTDFNLIDTMQLQLSRLSGGEKTEPIFIFRKG